MEILPPQRRAVYRPGVFDVSNLEQAKGIILTPEIGTSTGERWAKETPYLANEICSLMELGPESVVLDHGCGIGRISKALIEQSGCRVVGVDISQPMRLLAPEYVLSDRFVIWSPWTLDQMAAKGFAADAAVSLWVIQHVLNVPEELRRIAAAIKPGGLFYTLNQRTRCVPTDHGWVDDGFDIRGGLAAAFKEEKFYSLPITITTPQLAEGSVIQLLRKPAYMAESKPAV